MRENRVLTLYYHRVNVLETDYNLLCVSPIRFRQQMLSLKRKYQIVRFDDDWTMLDSNAVVITFDDGYFDNMKYALPVLEELEIPATIFVSTGTMNQQKELWWDELERLILNGETPSELRLNDDEYDCVWDTSTYEHRKNCYAGIHYLMKNFIDPDRRENWLQQLWHWRGLERMVRKDYHTLCEDDCRKLAEANMISIGAHTITHPSLAGLGIENQEREIRESIEKLSYVLGKRITLFSYPFGAPSIDFDDATIEICRKYGILKAASTENRLWDVSVSPYRIPRKIVRDWTLDIFERKIEEYWEE